MSQQEVLGKLRRLTGGLSPAPGDSSATLRAFERTLAQALLADGDLTIAGNVLDHEGSAPVDHGDGSARFAHLDDLFKARPATTDGAAPLVFRRETAFRSDLLAVSTPVWATGMAPSQTFGPFIDERGLSVWFDVFRRITLLAFAQQGSTAPVLLMPVRGPAAGRRSYRIEAGSVWIASRLIARTSALDGYYTGLRVKGGTLTLTQDAVLASGQLVIDATTTGTLQLDLDQQPPHPSTSMEASAAGFDADDAVLQLPSTCTLRFGALDNTLTVGPAACTSFGTAARFTFTPAPPLWVAPIGQILVRGDVTLNGSDPQVFFVESSRSALCTLEGHAPLDPDSGWLLPATRIDPAQLGVAAGTGALCIGLSAGLEAGWKGLKGGATRLLRPAIIADPDTLSVVDFFASNASGRQRWTLWKNQRNAHHSDITLTFGPLFPLVFVSSRADSEALYFFCGHRASFDRPLDGNGAPFRVESPIALAGMLQTAAAFRVMLFDELPLGGTPEASERHPLVLRNAFFSVSRPYSLFLAGDLTGDTSVERGEVALTFAIRRYLPTLADPYVASYTPLLRDDAAHGFGPLRRALTGFVKWPDRGAVDPADAADPLPDVPAYVHFRLTDLPTTSAASNAATVASRDFRTGLRSFDRVATTTASEPRADILVSHAIDGATARVLAPMSDTRSAGQIAAGAEAPDLRAATAALAAHPMLARVGDVTAQVDRTLAAVSERQGRPDALSPVTRQPTLAATRGDRTAYLAADTFTLLDVSTNADQMGVALGAVVQVERGPAGDTRLRTGRALFGVSTASASSDVALQIMNMDVVAPAQNLRALTLPQVSWEPLFNIPLKIEGKPDPDDLVTVAPGLVLFDNDGIPTRLFSESPYAVPIGPLPVTRHFLREFNHPHAPRDMHAVFTLPFAMLAQADFPRSPSLKPADDTHLAAHMPRFGSLRGGLQIKARPRPPSPTQRHSAAFPGWTLQLDNIRWSLAGLPLPGSTLGKNVKDIFNQEFFVDPTAKVPLTAMEISGYGASMFSDWLDRDAEVAQVSQARFDVMVGRTAHEVVQVRSILYPFAVHVVRTITLMRSANGYVFRSDSGWKAEGPGFYDYGYTLDIDPAPVPVANPFTFHAQPVKGVSSVREIRDFPDGGTFTSTFPLNDPGLPPEVLKLTLAQWQELFDVSASTDLLDVKLQAVVFDADVHLDHVVAGASIDPVTGDSIVQSRRMIGYVQLEPAAVLVPAHVFADLLAFQNGSLGGPVDCTIDIAQSKQQMRLSRVDVNGALDAAGKPVFVTAARGALLLPPDGSWSVVVQQTDTGDVKPVVEGQGVPLIKPNDSAEYRIAQPADAVVSTASKTHYGVLQSTGTQKLLFDVPRFTPSVAALKSDQTYFADAYKLLNAKGIFPNVANALALTDAEKVVEIVDAGVMRMAERSLDLSTLLPSKYRYAFIDEPGILRIYAEYANSAGAGSLALGFDSTTPALADRWKAALSNLSIVVDLGPFERLMWVDGKFDAASGVQPKYELPHLQFGGILDPVVKILRVLEQLTGGDFDDGMDVAMSNAADNWEYKFTCSQEIPVIRFPGALALSIDPNPPLKLEAGLKVGFYFNEVLAIPGDVKQLLPACGASVGFHGRLEVQCFTLGVASVYGVGQVDLGIAADTKAGVTLAMKFGFGAEVVVGLPVVANVNVLYMVEVGVSIDADRIVVTGLMLIRGHAEICSGLVGVAIQIEAGGSVSWTPARTDLVAQVSFTIDVCVLWVIDLDFSDSWVETRQIA